MASGCNGKRRISGACREGRRACDSRLAPATRESITGGWNTALISPQMTGSRDSIVDAARGPPGRHTRRIPASTSVRRSAPRAARVYSGTNVENASYPLGNCAETSAIAAGVQAEGAAFRIAELAVWATDRKAPRSRLRPAAVAGNVSGSSRRAVPWRFIFRGRRARSARRRSTKCCHSLFPCRPSQPSDERRRPGDRRTHACGAGPHESRRGRHAGGDRETVCRGKRRAILRRSASIRSTSRRRGRALDRGACSRCRDRDRREFSDGSNDIARALRETRRALAAGADEIDIVFPWRALSRRRPRGRRADAAGMQGDLRRKILKAILETGELGDPLLIREISFAALDAGADFIKTSTGKAKWRDTGGRARDARMHARKRRQGRLQGGRRRAGRSPRRVFTWRWRMKSSAAAGRRRRDSGSAPARCSRNCARHLRERRDGQPGCRRKQSAASATARCWVQRTCGPWREAWPMAAWRTPRSQPSRWRSFSGA